MSSRTIVAARRIASCGGALRLGFTLLEMMLVLSLMVVIAALVWPSLDKPFAAQRLRTSADQIRAELARGRVAAMQSGRLHVFSVDPSTGRFLVQPADEPTSMIAMSPATMSTTSTTPTVLRGQALPDGIRLQELLAVDDVTPLPQAAQAQAAAPPGPSSAPAASIAPPSTTAVSGPAAGSNAAGPTTAPQTIYFHPDGTTSSARFTLANQHGVTLVLELRGLTGATRASEPVSAGAMP